MWICHRGLKNHKISHLPSHFKVVFLIPRCFSYNFMEKCILLKADLSWHWIILHSWLWCSRRKMSKNGINIYMHIYMVKLFKWWLLVMQGWQKAISYFLWMFRYTVVLSQPVGTETAYKYFCTVRSGKRLSSMDLVWIRWSTCVTVWQDWHNYFFIWHCFLNSLTITSKVSY